MCDFLFLSFCYFLFNFWSLSDEAVSALAGNQVHCNPQTETIQEPLNLSSRQKPRSPLHKANGRIPGKPTQPLIVIYIWKIHFKCNSKVSIKKLVVNPDQSADCSGTMCISCCVMTATRNTFDGKIQTAWCSGSSTPMGLHVSGGTTRLVLRSVFQGWGTATHREGLKIVQDQDNVWSLFAEPTQYDIRENVPCFAALLQAEHHQKRARTKTPLQVCLFIFFIHLLLLPTITT